MKTFNFMSVLFVLIISIIMIFIIGMLASCGPARGLSVTKRHYSDGYAVSRPGKPQAYQMVKKEKPPESTLKSYPPDQIKVEKPDFLPENSPSREDQFAAKSTPVKANKKNFIPVRSVFPEALASVKRVIKNPRSIGQVISPAGNNTASVNTGEEGGAILWTIICILVVVWLISLLTGGWGLGGLIYIFLVVALILLLLRLLRIIVV